MVALISIIMVTEEDKRLIIPCYAIIVAYTFFMVSFSQCTIDLGYLCYIISDLIIGYEIFDREIYPRRLRILCVPILYWLGQYLTTTKLLQK